MCAIVRSPVLKVWFLIALAAGNRILTEDEIQGQAGNKRPIIGILALDSSLPYGKTFISATYVKYVEQAGARVVPIRGGQPEEYYARMVNWTNGALITGGGVSLQTSILARTARLVFAKAMELNKRGDYYPMWGTCLGFQMLCYLVEGENLLKPTDSANATWPLNFTADAKSSRMFASASPEIINALSSRPVTENYHHYSILSEDFDASKLSKFYKKLSVNNDRKGVEFVSTMEGKDVPIYGTQWHPEKNSFNWNPNYIINHSPEAVRVGQYMANFFVGEARKNSHRFPSIHEEETNMIQNFKHHFFIDGTFYDFYFIDPRDD